MNVTKFFVEHHTKGSNLFYDAFYSFYIANEPQFQYLVKDERDLIEKWKRALYPSNLGNLEVSLCFGLMSFWLYKNNYFIVEHPEFLERFESNNNFSNNEIYKKIRNINKETTSNNVITSQTREDYIDSLTIRKREMSIVLIDYDIEALLKKVSTRDEEFNNMGLNEKLYAIRNAYENIGKIDGKFIKVPFEEITNGYITNDLVNRFSKEIHCFRHGDVTMIEKRDSYSDEQKQFFVDFGLTLLNAYSRHLKLAKNQNLTI